MARAPRRRIPDYFLYGEARRGVAGSFVHVETIEARSAGHHWKIEPHLHQALNQLLVVAKGRGVALAEGAATQFRPPAVVVAPAGAVHGFEFEPGTLGFVISFADELLASMARREPAVAQLYSAPHTLELPERGADTAQLLRTARTLAQVHGTARTGVELAAEGWLAVLLSQLLPLSQPLLRPADAGLSRDRQLVMRFRGLVESGFRSGQSIPQYAQVLRVSEARLRNACLAAAGQPPLHLLHARVLLEAKRQLIYTPAPVREIAYGLGFEDAAYFTRFFTRRAGLSPRRYRSRGEQLQGSALSRPAPAPKRRP